MKRIAIILAVLTILLSACVNPVPPPNLDEDPIVVLSASAGSVGSATNVTATVTDDTPGDLVYEWRVGDSIIATESSVTHPNTQGLVVEVDAPSVSNGEITSGHTTTYTFESWPYTIDSDPIGVVNAPSQLLMHRYGKGVEVFVGEPVTVTDDILGIDHEVSFLGGNYGEWIAQGARFTIGAETVDLYFQEAQTLSLEGYEVTVTAFNHSLDNAGELASVSVEATYTYDGLTQQQQVKLTPDTGVQVVLPEGTVVEAYLEGGLFLGLLDESTFSIDAETTNVDTGDVNMLSDTTLWVESARLTKTPEDITGRASIWVGGVWAVLNEGGISQRYEPGQPVLFLDGVSVELSEDQAVVTNTDWDTEDVLDPLFRTFEWIVEDETLYFTDLTTITGWSTSFERAMFRPSRAGTYDVSVTVTDERGNTGSDQIAVTVE